MAVARFLKFRASEEMYPTMPTSRPTNAGTTGETLGGPHRPAPVLPSFVQKVAIVNGRSEAMTVLDTVLEAGRYDVVFVESSEHAYSQIKCACPDLVILYMSIEDVQAFQLLSMLKVDAETRRIPVLTFTTQYEGLKAQDEAHESEHEIFSSRHAPRMN